MNTVILTIATVFAGLMAGLFYAWSISVIPGLAQVSDQNYLQAFQAMNRAILNPAFFIAFMGQAIVLLLLSYLYYQSPQKGQFWCILAATAFYWIGCMAITMMGNVPLNNTLEVLQIGNMSPQEMAQFREGFEDKWNNLNWVRTISTLISLALLIIACLQNNPK